MITKATYYILGNGITFEEDEIEISSYLKIRKVSKMSVFELAGLGAQGFKQWSLIEPFCYLKNNFEIISSENESSFGYDILNRAWLLNTLLVLRKKTSINSIALLNQSWNKLKDINNVQANLCDYHVKMLKTESLNELNVGNGDIEWLKKYYENANTLAFKNEKFRYALEVINSWRYCVDVKSAIAILWAAIESIVNVSIEISYRLSLSISSLLYERGDERIQKFKEIKKLYTLRSKVVHGSNLKDSQIEKALVESFELLSELIVFMIEKNKLIKDIDFENAIFK
ncbi:HEPN domain-containing protein [Dokdonia sp. PRO95]|uniref:HEPN domain-containing protein n=1 Tax=Dokdonia sp. PRO95 TaxID=1239415 RepID=UPI000552AFDA|nr:HEPN domain-containing protein [Dokdonia sp. PRO95]